MHEPQSAAGVPLVGDVIAGKYRIDSVLGEGGMGIVYEAEHVILRQRVAIKALLPGAAVSSEVIERFSFEASTVARITSEHVVRVMDAGTLPNGSPYLVMEYLAGCDLDTLLARRGPLPPDEVADIALQALEALAHAHAAGIIHRDLKPANLFQANAPANRKIIKLLDFGISKSLGAAPDDDRVFGSPVYMSPEQLEKDAAVDLRTDLWSLGVVMYELLCGAPPFGGELVELLGAIRRAEPVPPNARDPRIPAGLSDVVLRCLLRDRSARWPSAVELAAALVPYGTGKWADALERVARALSLAQPVRTARRYESFENALQALEGRSFRAGEGAYESPIIVGRQSKLPLTATWTETLLPAPAEAAELAVTCLPPSSIDEPPPKPPALRLLLVDDSPIARAVHGDLLRRAGFDVRAAGSPSEVDAALEEYRPHLVLMDVMMPGLNGDVLCRRIKARFKATVPVVLLSDLPREELVERAEQAGADGYVAKPSAAGSGELIEYVRNVCAIAYSPEDLP
ncbi:MAG: protein kinase [Labilithrix sp.]|nr:protein kinase [Labilithrix sp.]